MERPGNAQGKRMRTARKVTLALVLVAVLASLAFDSGIGTPSAFGAGPFFLLCPLGGLEAMLAAKSFIPVAAISMAVVLVFTFVFGRAWCAWGCPVPPIRKFFKRDAAGAEKAAPGDSSATAVPLLEESEPSFAGSDSSSCAPLLQPSKENASHSFRNGFQTVASLSPRAAFSAPAADLQGVDGGTGQSGEGLEIASQSEDISFSKPLDGASPAAVADLQIAYVSTRQPVKEKGKGRLRHIAHDTRTWVLVGVLVAALVAGLPLFCLVCPIGLTFGSVASLWNLIVNKQVTMSVVVFPLALLVEVVLYRKWCVNLCPVAGMLNIVGQFAPFFRPRIAEATCLRYAGGSCDVCTSVCSEAIDKHASDATAQLGECTRCGECARSCPTASITLPPL